MPPRRVLFVCVGNACRSQMAEAFARARGGGLLEAHSAGVAPCGFIPPITRRLMLEKDIDLSEAVSKSIRATGRDSFDLVINMSGFPLPAALGGEKREWEVEDPYSLSEEEHREVRDRIERLVVELLDEFRREAPDQAR